MNNDVKEPLKKRQKSNLSLLIDNKRELQCKLDKVKIMIKNSKNFSKLAICIGLEDVINKYFQENKDNIPDNLCGSIHFQITKSSKVTSYISTEIKRYKYTDRIKCRHCDDLYRSRSLHDYKVKAHLMPIVCPGINIYLYIRNF